MFQFGEILCGVSTIFSHCEYKIESYCTDTGCSKKIVSIVSLAKYKEGKSFLGHHVVMFKVQRKIILEIHESSEES